MKLRIISKSREHYYLDWYASIDDFINLLENTDHDYIKCIANYDENALLKISEIESISIIKEDAQ